MRKFRSVVLILAIALSLLPSSSLAQSQCNRDAVIFYHGAGATPGWKFTLDHPLYFAWWEVWSYDTEISGGGGTPTNAWNVHWNGEIIIPRVTILYPTVSVYLRKYPYATPSTNMTVELWHLSDNDGHYCHAEQIACSETFDTSSWNSNYRWVSITGTGMAQGERYSLEVRCHDASNHYVKWGYDTDGGGFPENKGLIPYSDVCEGLSATPDWHYYSILLQGCWGTPLGVLTEDAYIDEDSRVILGGLVTDLGVETGADCYIDFGFSEELGDSELVDTIRDLRGTHGHYEHVLNSWPTNTTLYYQARIVGEVSNETALGAIKSIYMPTVVPRISCEVIENNAYNLTFETIISSIDDADWVTLNLTYSTDMACYNDTNELCMVTNATEGGRYVWSDTPGGEFEYGERYSFYATMCYNGSVMVRSDLRQFTRYDPQKAPWQNLVQEWLDNIFGGSGVGSINFTWVWWALAAIVALIVFALVTRKKNWRVGCGLGIVAGFGLLYLMVALDLVGGWLVVLLSIVGGFIIYYVVFRSARSGGGG